METSQLYRSMIRTRGYVIMNCLGSSMSPFLLSGDRIRLGRGTSLAIGTVVAYQGPKSKQPVMHRIIEEGAGFLVVMGDAWVRREHRIRKAEVIGVLDSVWKDSTGEWKSIDNLYNDSIRISQLSKEIVRIGDTEQLLKQRAQLAEKNRFVLLG